MEPGKGTTPTPDTAMPSAQLRGETMAYAAQSALYNMAGNLFEPYINYRIQKHAGAKTPAGKSGNYGQNLAGEFVGDIAGASALIFAEALFPQQLHHCTRTMRSWIDPLYTSVAHRVMKDEKSDPDYDKKVADWTLFHERNLVRSAIIAGTGIAANIGAQKLLLGNPSPTSLIFAGKLASTTLTTALSLGVRLAFPEKMKGMDEWMGRHIFAPMMQQQPAAHSHSHAERIEQASSPDKPDHSR